jgi:cell division protein FtsB
MGRKKGSASWHEQAEALKAEAEKLPYGKEREALEAKARQLEITSKINEWLSSPGLQPPKLV